MAVLVIFYISDFLLDLCDCPGSSVRRRPPPGAAPSAHYGGPHTSVLSRLDTRNLGVGCPCVCGICGLRCSKRRESDGTHFETRHCRLGSIQRSAISFFGITCLTRPADSGMLSLGETGELSPNASAMLRISTLSAWAQLEIASTQQAYLTDVLKPYRSTLASLWLASLRDYASIRIDSEFLHDTSSVALDSSYSSLGKEVLLPVRYCITSTSCIFL